MVHLDLDASDSERFDLAKYVKAEGVIKEFGNVMVIGKADLVTYKGPTMVAATLHAVAILLKEAKDWDWFVNLSADDYPLMTQDGKNQFFYCNFTKMYVCMYALWILDLKLGPVDVRLN